MKKILYHCDDEKVILNVIEIVCSRLARDEIYITYKGFLNPVELLEQIKQDGLPDVIISDGDMPNLSGLEVWKEVKKYTTQNNVKMPFFSFFTGGGNKTDEFARSNNLTIFYKPASKEIMKWIFDLFHKSL